MKGPSQPSGKYPKSPQIREYLCREAAELLASEKAINFHPMQRMGSADGKAFWKAIPELHKRGGNGTPRKLSASARIIFEHLFHNKESLIDTGINP